jgi:hypothetical protein
VSHSAASSTVAKKRTSIPFLDTLAAELVGWTIAASFSPAAAARGSQFLAVQS